jgi:hypothetical protein
LNRPSPMHMHRKLHRHMHRHHAPRACLLQFTDEVDGERREIVDKIERVLDLVGDAGGHLAERGELLGLNQAVLRGSQFFQRFRQFASARLYALEQADVLDRGSGIPAA